MARKSLRRKTEAKPNTGEKEDSADGISDVSTEEEETSQRKNQAIAKGKKPMAANKGKQNKWNFNEMTRGRKSTKGVVIGEAKRSETTPVKSGKRKVRYAVRSPCTIKSPLKKNYVDESSDDDEPKGKRSKPITTPVRSSKRKVRYAVRSPCTLKSPLKKNYVDFDSDDDEPKGKAKEKEADDFEDLEADSEEVCKRIKKDRNGDDDSDDNNGGGDGAGAHTNLSNLSLSEGLVAGN